VKLIGATTTVTVFLPEHHGLQQHAMTQAPQSNIFPAEIIMIAASRVND